MPVYSWVELHGAITHFPVSFLLGAAAFDLGALLFKKNEWRIVSFWLLVGAVVTAGPALLTGWLTGRSMFGRSGRYPEQYEWHWIAAVIASALAIILLWWRIHSKDRLEAGARTGSLVVVGAVALFVSYTGFLGGQMVFGSSPMGDEPGQGPPPGAAAKPPAPVDPKSVAVGQKLFASESCTDCHSMNGGPRKNGPDLTHEGRRNSDLNWQIEHLKDPKKMKPGSSMPPFDDLKPEQLKALAAFLVSRS